MRGTRKRLRGERRASDEAERGSRGSSWRGWGWGRLDGNNSRWSPGAEGGTWRLAGRRPLWLVGGLVWLGSPRWSGRPAAEGLDGEYGFPGDGGSPGWEGRILSENHERLNRDGRCLGRVELSPVEAKALKYQFSTLSTDLGQDAPPPS